MQEQGPKYIEVVNWVTENIRNGTFSMGEKLPSENELAMRFDLSRQTVRHAVDLLEQQKLVRRVRGSGTYVGDAVRTVRQKSYGNIAVISTFVDSYIFPPVMGGIEQVLSRAGYTMQVSFTGNRIERERDILDSLLEKGGIDGLVVEPSRSALPNPNLHYYRKLMEQQIPVLFFNCSYRELDLPCVAMDDERVGYKAAQYLIRAGHQKIAGIFKCDDGQGHLRYAGFADAVREAGIKADGRDVIWLATEDIDDLEQWPDYLMHRLEGYTGLVCYNDQVARMVTGLCARRGIRIPEDLSLVSIDNSDLAAFGEVPITSFSHPMEALGRKAAENIISMIGNPYFDGNYLFDSGAARRGSVKNLETGEADI